jgi:PAS domain S-box-containing protein
MGLNERGWLAAIIESSDDAIVSKTLEGVITSWNRGAERIFGWTAAEAVGRHITLIIPPERRAEEDDVLSRIRRGEIVDHFETVRVTKYGELRNISLSISPVRDERGVIVGASKIARDITDRRRLEEERDRSLRQVRDALAAAEEANRAKDHFLATVSHELRTPLNSILGYSKMVQSGQIDEEARERALGVIVRSGTTLARLVDDLLDLSRIVTGRMVLAFEKCELSALVEESIETVRPAADAKGIALTTDLAPNVGPILGAPDRLRQVVWNLAMNAIKFTPSGGRVDVRVRRSERDATLVVADSGIGISAGALARVFEQFHQEDPSSTRAHSGLGLGLALVKHLVEQHGGQVRAESPGKDLGATFTVTIPLATVPSADQ